MEATVAERGQITLPKAVRDALGLTKGTQLKVELDGGRIILRKNVDDAISRLRGRFKLPPGVTPTGRRCATPRSRAGRPGRPVTRRSRRTMIAIDSSVLIDLLSGDVRAAIAEDSLRQALARGRRRRLRRRRREIVRRPRLRSRAVRRASRRLGIRFLPTESRARCAPGEMQRRYSSA